MNRKPMSLTIVFIVLTLAMLIPLRASADLVTYQKEYSYQASEADSKISCRTISLEQVKSLLLEELGTYLERNTEVVNYEVTRDQIIALTAGIVRAQIITEKWDGQTYYIVAKIQVDPKELEKSIASLKEERQNISELEESKKRTKELLLEVERLKQKLKTAPDTSQKQEEQNKYIALTKELNAVDWFDKGNSIMVSGQLQDAITAFSKAIELNPEYARAYSVRGLAYAKADQPQKGINDCNKAIELMPNNAGAYINRGFAYFKSRYYDQAINDVNRAIEINPKSDRAYQVRGLCHLAEKAYSQAIENFDMAIKLNPNWGYPYSNRCLAYHMSGKAGLENIKDCDRAIEINPYNNEFYVNRGIAFINLKKYPDALADLNKAIDMNSKYVRAYFNRGIVLYHLNNFQEAINDLNLFIGSNPHFALENAYYFRALSYEKLNRKEELFADMEAAAKLGNPRAIRFLKQNRNR
ncbi:MAG: tetratricopeptide repeat protein [Desulfobacterales bacterium]